MARPKGEDRKLVLLGATATAFTQSDVAASTVVIVRNAGIAEGTLFRYFATKDDLINELYLFLKRDLCQLIMVNLNRSVTSTKTVTHYIQSNYINWGLNHTCRRRTIRQLAVSEKISKKAEQQANNMFPELRDPRHRSVRPEFMPDEYYAFGDRLFLSLAETTMEFATRGTTRANEHIPMGLEAVWRALIRKEQ